MAKDRTELWVVLGILVVLALLLLPAIQAARNGAIQHSQTAPAKEAFRSKLVGTKWQRVDNDGIRFELTPGGHALITDGGKDFHTEYEVDGTGIKGTLNLYTRSGWTLKWPWLSRPVNANS